MDFKRALSLRVFTSVKQRHGDKPLYEAIVLSAREHQLAGATVLRSPMGYGHDSTLHTATILRLSEDLPIIVEVIDTVEKVSAFMPALEEMTECGLIVTQEINIAKQGEKQ